MSLAFRSAQSANTNSAVSSLAVSKPAGLVAGDFLVIAACNNGNNAFSALSGFANRLNVNPSAGTFEVAVWTRLCDGSEASTFSPAASSGAPTGWVVVALCYSAAAAVTFDAIGTDDHTSAATSTSWVSNGVSTAAANEMVLFLSFNKGFGNPATGASPPSGFTEELDTSVTGNPSSFKSIYAADKVFSGTGPTGSITATGYAERTYCAAVAFAESAGGGSTFVPQVSIVMQ
jgi:hypothetical protein